MPTFWWQQCKLIFPFPLEKKVPVSLWQVQLEIQRAELGQVAMVRNLGLALNLNLKPD